MLEDSSSKVVVVYYYIYMRLKQILYPDNLTEPLYYVYIDNSKMKKDFIISKIEASQDGTPYIYVTFSDSNDYKLGGERQQNPFGPNMMAFTSPEDLMKNLPKMMSSISRMVGGSGSAFGDSPTIKMSMKEYEDIGIKVGDKVTIEIKKSENSGI
jgi:hypothetical protein